MVIPFRIGWTTSAMVILPVFHPIVPQTNPNIGFSVQDIIKAALEPAGFSRKSGVRARIPTTGMGIPPHRLRTEQPFSLPCFSKPTSYSMLVS
jgi:hypothetical protein